MEIRLFLLFRFIVFFTFLARYGGASLMVGSSGAFMVEFFTIRISSFFNPCFTTDLRHFRNLNCAPTTKNAFKVLIKGREIRFISSFVIIGFSIAIRCFHVSQIFLYEPQISLLISLAIHKELYKIVSLQSFLSIQTQTLRIFSLTISRVCPSVLVLLFCLFIFAVILY